MSITFSNLYFEYLQNFHYIFNDRHKVVSAEIIFRGVVRNLPMYWCTTLVKHERMLTALYVAVFKIKFQYRIRFALYLIQFLKS